MAAEKIILTGATGFIGSEVLARLLKRSSVADIIVLGRKRPVSHDSLLYLRLKEHGLEYDFNKLNFVECDFGNAELFQRALSTLPVENKNFRIVHMAAFIHAGAAHRDLQARINIGVTQDLLRFASEREAAHFIFLSSIVAFGGHVRPQLRSEKNYPEFPAASQSFSYFTSKREAHDYLLANAKVPTSIFCPGVVHGSLEQFKDSRGHLKALRQGRLSFAPRGGSNFVGLDRIGAAVENAAKSTPPATIETQLLVDENLSYRDFFQRYVRLARGDQAQKIRRVPGLLSFLVVNWVKLAHRLQWSVPSVLDGLAQGSFYLFFESEKKLPPTKGVDQSLRDSLNSL